MNFWSGKKNLGMRYAEDSIDIKNNDLMIGTVNENDLVSNKIIVRFQFI
jgi:hypothetical protein